MALSFSRVAAFEFLIRFRSIGRNRNRQAIGDLGRLSTASRATRASMLSATEAARAYQLQLLALGRSASVAAQRSNLLFSSLRRRGAFASPRAQQIGRRIRGAQNFRDSFSGRAATLGNRLFGRQGARAGARFSAGITRSRAVLARLNPVLRGVTFGFQSLFNVIGRGLSVYAQFAKINVLIGGALTLAGVLITRVADNYTNLTNRIRAATGGQVDIATEMQKIASIANRARAPLDTVAEVYGRVALNAEAYGISLERVAQFTELAAKAAKIGGATTREQSQAFIQLAQGIGSNRLSGDELRSVREQTPELAQSIARGLGIPFGELKKLGESGRLTSKAVVDAVIRDARNVELRFKRLEATFADSGTVIRSSISLFAGSVLSSLKLGPRAFDFFDGIAERFQELSEQSGNIGLALSRLPRFFEILGFGGTEKFLNFLQDIGEFFRNLPENIERAVQGLNRFVSDIDSGVDIEIAAQRAFGVSFGNLQNNPLLRFLGNDAPSVLSLIHI